MAVSRKISEYMTRASWIRKMFEEGARLKAEFGQDNVYDFSLGNPYLEPPREFKKALLELAENPVPGMHRYMPNAGYPDCRAKIAEDLSSLTGLFFEDKHVIMTVGAGGGLNVVLKSILDEGDEVVILAPYFVEYIFYIDNHGGKTVIAKTGEDFRFDFDELEKAFTGNTKALIINSPNNPTGVVYSEGDLKKLASFMEEKSKKYGNDIYVISDEPYRKILFDGVKYPSIASHYSNAFTVYSHSKDLGLAGERIGYIGISPEMTDLSETIGACTFTNRTLGFVNAPALMQRLVAPLQGVSIDSDIYQRKRDLFYDNLIDMGFKCNKPQGAFYLFPESPLEDDVAFVKKCIEDRVLVVPGSGFGTPGYFRISYCVPDEVIENSLESFRAIADKFDL